LNCLLIFPEELITPNTAVIIGQRAGELIDTHDLAQGINIRISLFNAGLGSGSIDKLEDEKLEITIKIDEEPPVRENLHLIAGVSRPQTVKKILHTSASYGIKKLSFVSSENSEQSYLRSKALFKENILKEMYLAIEQSVDCFLPEVKIYEKYWDFIKEFKEKEAIGESMKIIAYAPRMGEPAMPSSPINLKEKNQRVILAIGPETGWSENEKKDFSELGFISYSLGARIYRGETALAMLFGQLISARAQVSLRESQPQPKARTG
jgi:16S rRNA (uracil1498-N3)-methyltransferase